MNATGRPLQFVVQVQATLRGSAPLCEQPAGNPESDDVQYGDGGVHGCGLHPYAPASAQYPYV